MIQVARQAPVWNDRCLSCGVRSAVLSARALTTGAAVTTRGRLAEEANWEDTSSLAIQGHAPAQKPGWGFQKPDNAENGSDSCLVDALSLVSDVVSGDRRSGEERDLLKGLSEPVRGLEPARAHQPTSPQSTATSRAVSTSPPHVAQ